MGTRLARSGRRVTTRRVRCHTNDRLRRTVPDRTFRMVSLQARHTRNLRRPVTNALRQAVRRLTITHGQHHIITGRTFQNTTLLSRPNHNRWRLFRRLRRREVTPPPQACLPT